VEGTLHPLDGTCGASWWLLVAFHGGIQNITPPSTRWAGVCWPPWHREVLTIIFLLPHLFSLLHLKMCVGLEKLQSGPQSFNCIECDLYFFNFIHWHLIFYVFFYQIWSSFFWFLFILLLIFFYWILFFDLTPNHLILILFFNEFESRSYDCNFFYFEFSSWLIVFFLAISSLIVNFIEFSYHILCLYFFYHGFKTQSGSRPPSYPGSCVRLNDRGYRG